MYIGPRNKSGYNEHDLLLLPNCAEGQLRVKDMLLFFEQIVTFPMLSHSWRPDILNWLSLTGFIHMTSGGRRSAGFFGPPASNGAISPSLVDTILLLPLLIGSEHDKGTACQRPISMEWPPLLP